MSSVRVSECFSTFASRSVCAGCTEPNWPLRNSEAYPLMAARGVRSSCETAETKSLLALFSLVSWRLASSSSWVRSWMLRSRPWRALHASSYNAQPSMAMAS